MREDGYEPKRLALLRILQILEEYSDCEHPMTQQEIAERLHISLQAVEKHIQKALRIFSQMLGRETSLYTILILLWMMNANR